MLHLVQSNRMENLAKQLVDWLARGLSFKSSPLEADVVLVQSPGMAQWLKLVIAEQRGIAANIEFPLPSSYIWQRYKENIPNLPEQSAFTKDNMTWKLMHLLPGLLARDQFTEIRQYLEDGNTLKRYQLCHKIADVFDQYLVYRPEWILAWESGENSLPDIDVSAHPWQPILWRELSHFTKTLGESEFHRANLHHSLLDALNSPQDPGAPLYVFGISAIPKQQLEVLSALAKSREVVIFWLNPSWHYWADIVDQKRRDKKRLNTTLSEADYLDVGNPLLSSWGKLGRDYQDVLLNLEPQQHDEFDAVDEQSMLHNIQREILELTHRGASEELSAAELLSNGNNYPKLTVDEEDRSFQVQVCHSRVRELEILRDCLLRRFSHEPDLSPGDIIVMMPDVAGYAALIDGVFGTAEKSHFIPYSISDRSHSDESQIVPTFLQLMKLHRSRLPLTQVLSIFTTPSILAHFDVSESEAELVKSWASESGIRWGWNADDKVRWGLPEEAQNTWMFGLKRLLAGYAQSADRMLENGKNVISPFEDIEGQSATALGKFYVFCQRLLACLHFCQQEDLIENKVAESLALLSELFVENEESLQDITTIRQTIESMLLHQHQYTKPINQDVFVAELERKLNEKGVGQRFLAGYVNFCTLMPMRSIPFKHVCILGLNDGDYPRQSVPIGFDLMRLSAPQKGDRSRRTDDRYLFLEAILSARSSIHLSYIGFSQKDNSPKSPSVLLSELLEYCAQTFMLNSHSEESVESTESKLHEHIVQYYPLQPFSPQHFSAEMVYKRSFEKQWFEVATQQQAPFEEQVFIAQPLAELPEESFQRAIELDEFIQFFMNPAKVFFQSRWKTSLALKLSDVDDNEPFALDGLSRYKISHHLIEKQPQAAMTKLHAEGVLPIGNTGQLYLQDVEHQSQMIAEQVEQLRGNHHEVKQAVSLSIDDFQLSGVINRLYGEHLVLWRPGKIRAKDKIELWLRMLLLSTLQTTDANVQGHYVGTTGSTSLSCIDRQEALRHLKTFLSAWKQGQTSPLMCFPETAWAWLKSGDEQKTTELFYGTDFLSGEGQERHIARTCPDLSVYFNDFIHYAESLYRPLFELTEGQK